MLLLAVAVLGVVRASRSLTGGGAGPTRRQASVPLSGVRGAPPAAAAAAAAASTAADVAHHGTSVPQPAPTPPTTDPGVLPQTGAFPSAASPHFSTAMAAFWSAVTAGATERALPAFFPLAAYRQVKDLWDPEEDWTYRLVRAFDGDIEAARSSIGPDAPSAVLLGVQVHEEAAHWVSPGSCNNKVGYFEVPNSRVVYRVGGQVRSFGIASMISWRAEWYIVHLGAVDESPDRPVVDAPADGVGYAAPALTC